MLRYLRAMHYVQRSRQAREIEEIKTDWMGRKKWMQCVCCSCHVNWTKHEYLQWDGCCLLNVITVPFRYLSLFLSLSPFLPSLTLSIQILYFFIFRVALHSHFPTQISCIVFIHHRIGESAFGGNSTNNINSNNKKTYYSIPLNIYFIRNFISFPSVFFACFRLNRFKPVQVWFYLQFAECEL